MEVDQKCYPFAASSINFSMMALNALRSGVSMRTQKNTPLQAYSSTALLVVVAVTAVVAVAVAMGHDS